VTRSAIGRAIVGLGFLVVLTGCATASTDRVREPVETAVTPRLGQPVQWIQGGPEDAAVREAVRALLARPLTADAAVQIALLTNPELQAGYEGLGVAQADLVQAGLLANPVFGAEVRLGEGTEATLDVVQDFLSVLTGPARRTIAAGSLERAQLELGHQALEIAAEVRAGYYRLVADEEALGLLRQVVSATEAAAELAERQVQAGTLTRRDQALQQTLYAQVVLELAVAETRRGVDREALNRLLGLWGPETAWRLPDRLPDVPATVPPLEGLEAFAVDRRLDLAAARKSVETATRSTELGRSTRFLPSLGLGVASERDSDGTWRTGPKLEVGLPLFDQGQARLLSLEAEQRRQARILGGLAVTVRSQVREAWQRLAATQGAVMHYRTVLLPLSQRVVEETQRLYNGALVGVYDLVRSKQDQINAGRDYIAALRDYWVARAELERVLGAPLPSATAK
jgi:cobalt-zinc-cadmium efflux system outer membrane protein